MHRLGPPVQIAYAVPDAALAAAEWAERFGVGPFFVRRHIPLTDVVYRGHPADFDHTSAYGQWGQVMIELVQDHGSTPSVVRERFGPRQSGLHHVAHIVADLDEATRRLDTLGFPLAMTARSSPTTRFHFVDAVAEFGHFIELYQRSERVDAFYAMVRDAAAGWNGEEPVREL